MYVEGVAVVRVRVPMEQVGVTVTLWVPVRLNVVVWAAVGVKEGLRLVDSDGVAVGIEAVRVALGWGVQDCVWDCVRLWLWAQLLVAEGEVLEDGENVDVGGEGL